MKSCRRVTLTAGEDGLETGETGGSELAVTNALLSALVVRGTTPSANKETARRAPGGMAWV